MNNKQRLERFFEAFISGDMEAVDARSIRILKLPSQQRFHTVAHIKGLMVGINS